MESKKRFPADTGRVFDVLGLIKDHVLPPDSLEVLLILGDLDKKNQRRPGKYAISYVPAGSL